MTEFNMTPRQLCKSFLAVFTAAQILVIPSLHAQEKTAKSDILGNWRWQDDAMKKGGSFSELEFENGGKIVGFSYMSGVFSKGGETLGSDYGSYQIHGDRLFIKAPRKIRDGWPDRGEDHPDKYSCHITMDALRASFRLDDCPFSGIWTKAAPRT